MRQLGRLDKFAVIMGPFSEHTQNVSCANNGKQIRLWIAVNGREEHMAARFDQGFGRPE